MKYNKQSLLNSLQADVRQIILQASQLQAKPVKMLQMQPQFQQWSAAQILEHLNIYARHYIGKIEEALHGRQPASKATFRPGWLGNYFTKMMLPDTNNIVGNKMKSPKNAWPSLQPDPQKQLKEFLEHQYHLLNLLEIAKQANLEAIRIPTTLHPLLRLKLGDTFRFFIAHQQRHAVQLQNAMALLERSVYPENVKERTVISKVG